jgi:hypothetical protein
MDFDIRPAQPEEMGQLGLMASYSYGGAFGDGEDNISASGTRPEWTLCAFDPGATTEHGNGGYIRGWHPSRISTTWLGAPHHDPGLC